MICGGMVRCEVLRLLKVQFVGIYGILKEKEVVSRNFCEGNLLGIDKASLTQNLRLKE